MMMTANFPAEIHKTISDDWLNGDYASVGNDPTYGVENGLHYCDCRYIYVASQDQTIGLMPRGVAIESGNVQGVTFAYVNGELWAENPAFRDNHPVPTGALMHSIRFKRIYAENTTARGIRIYG